MIATTYSLPKEKKGSPIIEIYGRSRTGKSITVLVKDYYPYCYFLKNDKILQNIQKAYPSEYISHQLVQLEYQGIKQPFYQVWFYSPKIIHDIRKSYDKQTRFMSADIVFPLRYFYDNDLGACIKVEGSITNNKKYTSDIIIESKKLTRIKQAFQPPLTYLSFDIESSLITNEIITLSVYIKNASGDIVTRKLIGHERGIIKEFEYLVNTHDPDIITGYNIIHYDFPQLTKRAKKCGIDKLFLSRNGTPTMQQRKNKDKWIIRGRIVADAWLLNKKLKNPPQESLAYVSEHLLGETKLDVNAKHIDKEWELDPNKVLDYCLKDSELALRIIEEIEVVKRNMDLAAVSKLPLEQVFQMKTSVLVDSLLIREADKHDIGVPCMNFSGIVGDKIQGAFVKKATPGLHKWVIVVDFKSLYPSIIIEHNLCTTTYSPNNGTILSPIGAKFLTKDIKEGMLPRVLKKLLDQREFFKSQRKADPDNYDYWEGMQNATKVVCNAHYGLVTSDFYRFTNKSVGASVTSFAREAIKGVIETLEKQGYIILYGDTDSAFLQSPVEGLEASVEFGKKIEQELSGGGLVLEFEKLLSALFMHGAKKRYVGKIVWPHTDDLVRGYETRRKDTFELIRDEMKLIFDLILDDRAEEAVTRAKQIVFDTKKGRVPVKKLIISKSCRPFTEYKNPERMAQVQASKKHKEYTGEPFIPYMKIAWIVTDSDITPQEVEPYLEPWQKTPDWLYYAQRTARALGRVTEVYNWDEQALMLGNRQVGLGVFIEI